MGLTQAAQGWWTTTTGLPGPWPRTRTQKFLTASDQHDNFQEEQRMTLEAPTTARERQGANEYYQEQTTARPRRPVPPGADRGAARESAPGPTGVQAVGGPTSRSDGLGVPGCLALPAEEAERAEAHSNPKTGRGMRSPVPGAPDPMEMRSDMGDGNEE